jgi:hypothetical protein
MLLVIQVLVVIAALVRASSFQAFDPFGAVPESESTMAGPVVCQLEPGSHESSWSDHRLQERYEGVARRLPAPKDWPGYPRLAMAGAPLHNLPGGPKRPTLENTDSLFVVTIFALRNQYPNKNFLFLATFLLEPE